MTEPANREAYLPYAPQPDPATPRPLAAILEDLHRPIHESFLQTKTKKGTEITFISWHTAVRILDRYAPGWHYPAPQIAMADGQVVVSVQIGIPTSDQGIVWRGATGWDEDEEKAYGDASDRAESQALRRACAKFGLCLYLYYEKGAHGPTQQQRPQTQSTSQKESRGPSNGAPPSKPAEAATAPQEGNQSTIDTPLRQAWTDFRYVGPMYGLTNDPAQVKHMREAYPGRRMQELTAADVWAQSTAIRAALGMAPHPVSGAVDLEAVS